MNFLKIFISFAVLGSIPFAVSNEIFVNGEAEAHQETEPPCDGEKGAAHPFGGGFVAASATAEPTAYVGPNAQVCDGSYVLKNARIHGHAKVACKSVIGHYAFIYGQATVCASCIDGYAKVGEDATVFKKIVTDYAHIYGDVNLSYGCPIGGYQEVSGHRMVAPQSRGGKSECFRVVNFNNLAPTPAGEPTEGDFNNLAPTPAGEPTEGDFNNLKLEGAMFDCFRRHYFSTT